jgi:hypothetical protein
MSPRSWKWSLPRVAGTPRIIDEGEGVGEVLSRMKLTCSAVITGAAALVLVAALPSADREAIEGGRIYQGELR